MGGYYENLERDWAPSAPGFHAGDRKSLDTHMHLMEAFTTLTAASGQAIHRRKLVEIIDLVVIRRTFNAERVGDAPAQPTKTTSFGHNVELVWLMRLAIETAKIDPARYEPVMRALLDHAAKVGIDWELGGIYRDGLRGGGALVLEKEFWQNAESLVGFLDAFYSIWDFVNGKMINHAVGEWRVLLSREDDPIDTDLDTEWKVAYHTGRAMIECEQRLKRLLSDK